MNVSGYLQLLGFPATDKVTGFSGVVVSISFDLYGCIQAVVAPPMNEKGETPEGRWFDVARLQTSGARVMAPPAAWTADKGPAQKPARRA